MLRNLVLWIFFCNVLFRDEEANKLVKLEEYSHMQLAGFIVLVFGVLVFNEILVIPLFGFNKNTRVAIEARKVMMRRVHTDLDNTGEDISMDQSEKKILY